MTTAVLSVLEPIDITPSMLKSSSVPQTIGLFDPKKTYAAGDQCRSDVTNRVYESVKDSNLNHDPTIDANLAGTTPWWMDVSATNRWMLFDSQVNTQTVADSPCTFVLEPGAADAAYWAAMDADVLQFTVRDKAGGNVVYDKRQVLEASAPGDYDEYFWGAFKPMTDFIVTDIDPYYACEITVTLIKVTGQVKCGLMALGRLAPLGKTLADAQVTPRSYSYIKTDDFGNTQIKRRSRATDMDVTAVLDRSEASNVLAALQRLQDVPCAWIASSTPDYAGLRGFGLGTGVITYNGSDRCTLKFKMQGLI